MYISSPKRLVRSSVRAEYHHFSSCELSAFSHFRHLCRLIFGAFYHAAMPTDARFRLSFASFRVFVSSTNLATRVLRQRRHCQVRQVRLRPLISLLPTLLWTAGLPKSSRLHSDLRAYTTASVVQHSGYPIDRRGGPPCTVGRSCTAGPSRVWEMQQTWQR